MTLDTLTVGLGWGRMISAVEEAARALMQTSFTPVVREAGDLSVGFFDRRARLIAQAVTGTPGHINTMATAVEHFARAFPLGTLHPGDVLVGNDPWLTSGHLHDITLVTPLFYRNRPIGWAANTCHMSDIGGRTLGPEALDNFEEGLHIPILRLLHRGETDRVAEAFIRANVRTPNMVMGDLMAMASANYRAETRLREILKDLGLEDIEALGDAVCDRSEQAVRRTIGELPDGTSRGEITLDGLGDPLTLRAAVTVQGDGLTVDYTGTSPQTHGGVNVVLNYTHAYTTYPLACVLNPDIPHNAGSFRPIRVTAPEGTVLNARRPAPVAARHIVGHFLPGAVFQALGGICPERVPAEGSYGLWAAQFEGEDGRGRPFVLTLFSNGGMGARRGGHGLSATGFPSGVQNIPAEIIESTTPLMVHERSLREGSGGEGRWRGGRGQVLSLGLREGRATFTPIAERLHYAARGREGGGPGAPGRVLWLPAGQEPVELAPPLGKRRMAPGDRVTLKLPGGGGYGRKDSD